MSRQRVLLVDDDAELTGSVADYLRLENFEPVVAIDGDAARKELTGGSFDIVVLDVMMPGESGFELLRHLRHSSELPVLMLTARGEEVDRVVGLELGADDYLTKPFHLRELAARLRAILRRFHRGDNELRLQLASLTLDRSCLAVEIEGEAVRLTSAEFMTLEALMREHGKLVSRANLTQRALGRPLEPYDRSIDTHVSSLRRKLGLEPGGSIEIRNVRGKGYILKAEGAGP